MHWRKRVFADLSILVVIACLVPLWALGANRVWLPQVTLPEGATGQPIEVHCEHDIVLTAYSLVISYDDEFVEIDSATVAGTSAAGAEFAQLVIVAEVQAVICTVVLDTAPPFTRSLPPAADHTLARLTVSLLPAAIAGTRTSLSFKTNFDDGHHVYDTLLTDSDSNSITPARADGSIDVVAAGSDVDPIANAGPDIVVPEGSAVGLDGSASYSPAGEALGYSWAADPPVDLSGVDTSQPAITFTAPEVDADADVACTLTVTGQTSSRQSSDEVRVQIIDLDSRTATCDASGATQGLIDNGERAVLFQGTIAWDSPGEGLAWHRVRFRGVGRGNESALLQDARLYVDSDGGGFFDDDDQQLGSAISVIPANDVLEFVFLHEIPNGQARTYYLVAKVKKPRGTSAGMPVALVVTGLALALSIRRRGSPGRGFSVTLAACALGIAFLFAACDDGGGASRKVQFEIQAASDMDLRGATTGVQIEPDALFPLAGPVIEV